MWDQTKLMAAVSDAGDDYGGHVAAFEVSVSGNNLRIALKDADGGLLASYLVEPDGELTRLGD